MEQICNRCKGPLEKVRTYYSKKCVCRKCQHEKASIRVALRKYEAQKRLPTKSS